MTNSEEQEIKEFEKKIKIISKDKLGSIEPFYGGINSDEK